ncbi:MAG: GNAT family N-acetyltransferase [Meiothermus sp.]
MYTFRRAALADQATIIYHRRQMFLDMGSPERAEMAERVFPGWLEPALQDGTYLGLFAEHEGKVVAGTGIMFYHWLPGPDHKTLRGYLLNVFVEAEHRRKGLAKELVRQALEICQERGITVVTLHASEMGRPVYESLGFKPLNEMIWRVG